MTSLPISKIVDQIFTAFAEHNAGVVVVSAPTGSGKSIGIPNFLAQIGSRVFVSVPTVSAVYSLSEFQRDVLRSQELGDKISVGTAAESKVDYTPQTNIVYATSGHLRRKLVEITRQEPKGESKDLTFCDVLFVDEIHTGSLDNTLILQFWIRAVNDGKQVPVLLLSSATMDGIPINFPNIPVEFISLDMRMFPVKTLYLSNPDFSELQPEAQGRYFAAVETVKHILSTSKPKGSILIFAPGQGEVATIIDLIQKENIPNLDILPAFAALSSIELQKINNPQAPGRTKIVVATNVAEAALTLPDLEIVIDTLTEKRQETSETGAPRLQTRMVAKSSADQRCGRTGRTMPGTCYRMITKQGYEKLETQRPEELERIPMTSTLLELFDAHIDPQKLLGSRLDPIRYGSALRELFTFGLIDANNNVSSLGRKVAAFPLSVRFGFLLVQLVEEKIPPFVALSIAALLDCYGPSYFIFQRDSSETSNPGYLPFIEEGEAPLYPHQEGNDLLSLLNFWDALMDHTGGMLGTIPEREIYDFCRTYTCSPRKIRELLHIAYECLKISRRLWGDSVVVAPFRQLRAYNLVKDSGILAKIGIPATLQPNRRYMGENRTIYTLDRFRISPNPAPKNVIILLSHHVGKMNMASIIIPA